MRIAHSRRSKEIVNLTSIIRNIVKRDIPKYATHMFAVSRNAGEWLFGKDNMDLGKVTIWPNAIDSKAFRFNPETRGTVRAKMEWADKTVLIHVGNFTYPKNHPFLLDIFDAFAKDNDNAVLALVGKGDTELEAIKSKAVSLGLQDKVQFLGGREDVPDLLQAADAFVFPSINEGFPGAVLEAQAAGLPCLISDCITDEVVILDSTVQMPLERPATEWAAKIKELLETRRKDTYQDIRQAGYDIRDLVRRLEEFYLSC